MPETNELVHETVYCSPRRSRTLPHASYIEKPFGSNQTICTRFLLLRKCFKNLILLIINENTLDSIYCDKQRISYCEAKALTKRLLRVHRSLPLVPIQSHINPVYVIPSYFFKISGRNIFQKPRSHLQILGAGRVLQKFQSKPPHVLDRYIIWVMQYDLKIYNETPLYAVFPTSFNVVVSTSEINFPEQIW
jgi:hypothetical protein